MRLVSELLMKQSFLIKEVAAWSGCAGRFCFSPLFSFVHGISPFHARSDAAKLGLVVANEEFAGGFVRRPKKLTPPLPGKETRLFPTS